MDDQATTTSKHPHILVFPSPIEYPLTSILFDLSELLCLSGVHVTFLLTPYTHTLLFNQTHIDSRLNPYPNFHLHTIPCPQSDDPFDHLEPIFKDLLTSNTLTSNERGPLTCIISDGFMSFFYDVADQIHQLPVFSVLTLTPCSFTVDDLASMCLSHDLADSFLRKQMKDLNRAHGLILNTFKALDGPGPGPGRVLSKIGGSNVYASGPIHAQLKVRQESKRMTPFLNYSVDENDSCMEWLDSKQPKSVIYVNIENELELTPAQTLELWNGLVNSGKGFLWVRRAESILGEARVPPKIIKGTKERGYIVNSASNVQVLAHKAVGGFLTRGQWDSVIQGITEGVPMICWPTTCDQQVNSKFVDRIWKIGIDIEGKFDRNIVEKTIRDVMGLRGELMENANKLKNASRKSVGKGGSSYARFDHLVDDIRSVYR